MDSRAGLESGNRGTWCLQRPLRRGRGGVEQRERNTSSDAPGPAVRPGTRTWAREKNFRVRHGGVACGADSRARGLHQRMHGYQAPAKEEAREMRVRSSVLSRPAEGEPPQLHSQHAQRRVLNETPLRQAGASDTHAEPKERVAVGGHVVESVQSLREGKDAGQRSVPVRTSPATSRVAEAALSGSGFEVTPAPGVHESATVGVKEIKRSPPSEPCGEDEEGQREVPQIVESQTPEGGTPRPRTCTSYLLRVTEGEDNPPTGSSPAAGVELCWPETKKVGYSAKEEKRETGEMLAATDSRRKHTGVSQLVPQTSSTKIEHRERGGAGQGAPVFTHGVQVRAQDYGKVLAATANTPRSALVSPPRDGEASRRVQASQVRCGADDEASPSLSAYTPWGLGAPSRRDSLRPVSAEGFAGFSVTPGGPRGLPSSLPQFSSFSQDGHGLPTGGPSLPAEEGECPAPRTWAQRMAESTRSRTVHVAAGEPWRAGGKKGSASGEAAQAAGNAVHGERGYGQNAPQPPPTDAAVSPVSLPSVVVADTPGPAYPPCRCFHQSVGSLLPSSSPVSSSPPSCPPAGRASAASSLVPSLACLPAGSVSGAPATSGPADCLAAPPTSCWSRGPSAAVKQAPSKSRSKDVWCLPHALIRVEVFVHVGESIRTPRCWATG